MKKVLASISVALALTAVLSMPASAVAVITGEGFGKTTKNTWVVDKYEPEEFDASDNQLYLSVGTKGYYRNRPADQKDKTYALQGKKMELDKTTNNTWTATVKINVDDSWMSSDSFRKRAEFRVDLVDADGAAVTPSPALALIKGGTAAPVFKFVNPKANGGWGMGDKYIDGDKEMVGFDLEQGWHTLFIKSTKGVITYYVDEKKLGNCTLGETDVYPAYMALNVYNFERPDMVTWDNAYLYDGAYGMVQRSSSVSASREERLNSQYASKRQRWVDSHTVYEDRNGSVVKWITKSAWESKYPTTPLPANSKMDKEIPESYWDY